MPDQKVDPQDRPPFIDGHEPDAVREAITASPGVSPLLALLGHCISRLTDTVLITEGGPLDEPGPRIIFVNEGFERQTGYSADEVIGR